MSKQLDSSQLFFQFDQASHQKTTGTDIAKNSSPKKIISFQVALDQRDSETRKQNYKTIARLARHLG